MMDWDEGDFILLVVGIVVAVLVVFVVVLSIKEVNEWEAFRVAHHCKVTAHISGSSFTTVGPVIGSNGGVGVGVGSMPSKTGWTCDDGVTYFR